MNSLLLLFSAFFHAHWNTLLKSNPHKELNVVLIFAIGAVISFPLTIIFVDYYPTQQALFWGLGSGIFEGFYGFCLSKTLTKCPLGLSYIIMRGGAMILVWIISIIFINESVTLPGIIGVLFVFSGICLVNNFSTFREFIQQLKFLNWAYLSGICIAGYHICYGKSLESGMHPIMLYAIASFVSTMILLLFFRTLIWKSFSKNFSFNHVLAGLSATTSFLSFLWALQFVGAGFAITLRNSSIAFTQVFAFFLGEKISWKQWVGALLVMGGIAIINIY